MTTAIPDTCRLTIVAASRRADLAVPANLAVAELLTTVVSSLGREAADTGVAQGGWELQRAAEGPLDPSSTLTACGVRDGELLYLCTRRARLPAVVFDDIPDAVATGIATRTPRWQPVHTHRAATGFAAASLSVVLGTLALTTPSRTGTCVLAAIGIVLLLLTAVALGRRWDRRGPALVAAGFAAAFGALGAAAAVGGTHALWRLGAMPGLAAAGTAAVIAVGSLLVLGDGCAGFVAITALSMLTVIGTGIVTLTALDAASAAAVIATVALTCAPSLPSLSLRLSRLPLPTLDRDPSDPRPATDPVDSCRILAQTVRADQLLTGLVAGVALAIAAAATIISSHGTSGCVLAAVLAAVCLLRARLFTGTAQRANLLLAGGISLASVVLVGALQTHGTSRLLTVATPAVVVALVLLVSTVALPERRHGPLLSRTADVIESLLVLSVIPLALAVTGVYGMLRTLHPG